MPRQYLADLLRCPHAFVHVVSNDELAVNFYCHGRAAAALLGLTMAYFSLHQSLSISCRSLERMVPSLQSPIDTLRSPVYLRAGQ